MVTGAPDEQFLPRKDLGSIEDGIRERAHEFAESASDQDTLVAFIELNDLPEDMKGEVIRLGLAELRKRENAGNAEALLRRAEVNRPLGRRGLRGLRISRPV